MKRSTGVALVLALVPTLWVLKERPWNRSSGPTTSPSGTREPELPRVGSGEGASQGRPISRHETVELPSSAPDLTLVFRALQSHDLDQVREQVSDLINLQPSPRQIDTLLGMLEGEDDPGVKILGVILCRALGAGKEDLKDFLIDRDGATSCTAAIVLAIDPAQLGSGRGLYGNDASGCWSCWLAILCMAERSGSPLKVLETLGSPEISPRFDPEGFLERALQAGKGTFDERSLEALLRARSPALQFMGNRISELPEKRSIALPFLADQGEPENVRAFLMHAIADQLVGEDLSWIGVSLTEARSTELVDESTRAAARLSPENTIELLKHKLSSPCEAEIQATLVAISGCPTILHDRELSGAVAKFVEGGASSEQRTRILDRVAAYSAENSNVDPIIRAGLSRRDYSTLLGALNAIRRSGRRSDFERELRQIEEGNYPAGIQQAAAKLLAGK